MIDVTSEARRTFPMAAGSISSVRRFVDDTLAQVDLDHHREVARLVATELATNAVRHAVALTFDLLIHADEVLRLAVEDGDDQPVEVRVPTAEDSEGRGLQIVARLCDRWGVEQLASGKRVWCELDL